MTSGSPTVEVVGDASTCEDPPVPEHDHARTSPAPSRDHRLLGLAAAGSLALALVIGSASPALAAPPVPSGPDAAGASPRVVPPLPGLSVTSTSGGTRVTPPTPASPARPSAGSSGAPTGSPSGAGTGSAPGTASTAATPSGPGTTGPTAGPTAGPTTDAGTSATSDPTTGAPTTDPASDPAAVPTLDAQVSNALVGGSGRDIDNLTYSLSTVDEKMNGMGGDDPVKGLVADLSRGALAITRSTFDGLNAVGLVSDNQLVVARCVFGEVDDAISAMVSNSFDADRTRFALATCVSALGPEDALLRSQLLDAIGTGQVAVPANPGTPADPVVNPAPSQPTTPSDPTPFPSTNPRFVAPAQGTFTSGFGSRWGSFHYGIDIANRIGTPIRAAADGTVINAGPAQGFGLWVRIRHDDGTITVYGHVNEVVAPTGTRVSAGQEIATIGNRGQSTGPHLHFEVWQNGKDKIDPLPWLAQRGINLGAMQG